MRRADQEKPSGTGLEARVHHMRSASNATFGVL